MFQALASLAVAWDPVASGEGIGEGQHWPSVGRPAETDSCGRRPVQRGTRSSESRHRRVSGERFRLDATQSTKETDPSDRTAHVGNPRLQRSVVATRLCHGSASGSLGPVRGGDAKGLQSFCNPNARSAMGCVGTPWETGL